MEDFMRINAESRKEVGKKIAKKLRREGKIPAIIYGEKKETIPVSLFLDDVKGILKTNKKENTVLRIQRGDIEVDAMLKELQYDYLSEKIIHADFLRIDIDKKVMVNVPITVRGEPIGVKMEDGFLGFMTREIKIKCLPVNIPKEYVVAIDDLHSGDSIKAEDLDLGEDIKLVSDPHSVICAVIAKVRKEEEEAGEEEAAGEEGVKAPEAETKPETEKETKDKE